MAVDTTDQNASAAARNHPPGTQPGSQGAAEAGREGWAEAWERSRWVEDLGEGRLSAWYSRQISGLPHQKVVTARSPAPTLRAPWQCVPGTPPGALASFHR